MKMVVTDLDGTLLRNDRTISERTLNAISTLQDYGIKFVIATARAPRSVMKLLPLREFTNCKALKSGNLLTSAFLMSKYV